MNSTKRIYIRSFFIYLVASVFIGVSFALLSGIWPKSITGWVIILIFGLPTMILGEFIGEKLFSDEINHAMDKDRKDNLISARRMAYALIIGIVTTIVTVLLGFISAMVYVLGLLFYVRCPSCKGNLGYALSWPVTWVLSVSKEIKFCQFCGTSLDKEI